VTPDATGEQHLLDIAVAEGEAEAEPDGMADDLGRKAMVFIAFRVDSRRHVSGPSGSVVAHPSVNDRLITPPAGKRRHKLTKPEELLLQEAAPKESAGGGRLFSPGAQRGETPARQVAGIARRHKPESALASTGQTD